jgi:group II intron reverse transcriptase/maturase
MNIHARKPIPIEFVWVVAAYQKVRKGGKATGIDEESWTEFDKDPEKNCYVIWNRLASGSYHPQPVREVEIPKKDGKMRKLGIPTLRDRIAQQVVKEFMEEHIDQKFHPHSYGYRPMKSAHDALRQVQQNCLNQSWIIDMDISNFFDEIDHELMLKAVEHIMPEDARWWVMIYVKRWLETPVQQSTGMLRERQGKGTPQGGVISPLLANLYLHYSLDLWLSSRHKQVSFVRYADDMVVHCNSKQEAEQVLDDIRERLTQVKLAIKESKTRIAYCKDYKRKQSHETVKFEFLGYSFQPMLMKSKQKEGGHFTGFGSRISPSNEQKITQQIREDGTLRNTSLQISDIAKVLNPRLRGWINYYSLFSRYSLHRVMVRLENRLLKWLRQKYRLGYKKAVSKLNMIRKEQPRLFYHWEMRIV